MVVELHGFKCPICGGKDFFPIERRDERLAKCVTCGKESKEKDIYKSQDCEDGACKI